MKQYTAYYLQGGYEYEAAIITVLAETLSQAVERVESELRQNPSRRRYLEMWERDGHIIREKVTDACWKCGQQRQISTPSDCIHCGAGYTPF